MQLAIEKFKQNIDRVRHLHGVYQHLSNNVTVAVDLDDLLRAEIVMTVSALDHYIHDLTRMGMIECWNGTRKKTDAFGKFAVRISTIVSPISPTSMLNNLDNEIRFKHSTLSFQKSDKIADAVRLFTDIKLWEEVSKLLRMPLRDVKIKLDLIADRRNKIVHEADVDPSYPRQLWPIDAKMVVEMVDYIDSIAFSIQQVSA